VFAACKFPAGPAGPAGADGAPGAQGPKGEDGTGVISGTVSISGDARVHETLTAVYTSSDNFPVTNYQWYKNGAQIGSSSTYTLAPADLNAQLTVRVYCAGAIGYKESAPVTVAAFGPSVAGTLTACTDGNTWNNKAEGLVSADEPVKWYSFTATGGTYNVKCDSRSGGSGAYTAYTYVTAYGSDGSVLFPETFALYSTPQTISGYTGTVYLKVLGSSTYGTFAIMFYQ
jgi:hypothetical protein